jgi:hypothetical protein
MRLEPGLEDGSIKFVAIAKNGVRKHAWVAVDLDPLA